MKLASLVKRAYLLFFLILLFVSFGAHAQEVVPFSPRLDGDNIEIRGDIIFVGNNILNRASEANPAEANTPYNGTANNNSLWMEYIDIDADASTFSSSSAELNITDPSCSEVRYAGLYWAGTYPNERSTDGGAQFTGTTRIEEWNEIKFKIPGGTYVDLIADNDPDLPGEEDDIIFDGIDPSSGGFFKDAPVICYKEVTDLIRSNSDPNGEYTAANIRATRGTRNGSSSAGWVLVIIYENPNESGKFISTFDGYAGLSGAVGNVDVAVNGFRTLPSPFPVRARVGVAALEGDRGITNDRFYISANSVAGYTNLSTTLNPDNNFFNSTITTDGAEVPTRTPYGTNTLGTDIDLFNLNNPNETVLPNDESGAVLRFTSTGDGYGPFLTAFSVEIIEPNIVLEKRVEDIGGNDITGSGVNLGQTLDYVLSFRNLGNDNAANYTIRDVLPVNTTFVSADYTGAPGVTHVFDAATNEITFTVPDDLVEMTDPTYTIRLRVRVAENCFDFIDACTDLIENLAYSTYQGEINSAVITDDPSVSDFDNCGFVTPGATNFLLDDLTACNYTRTVQLCGDNVLLDAGDGFDNYVWVLDSNNNSQIDASDPVLNDGNPDSDFSTQQVDQTGTYIVNKQVADPCKDFNEIIIVELFGATQTNPITALINDTSNTIEGEILVCPNDGDELPQVFLCGLNDTELLQINIPDADSIVWEQLDDTSCSAAPDDCANKDNTCSWNTVSTGGDFLASTPGEFRLVINYQNGCFSRFYFNVFRNNLDLLHTSRDIVCSTPGNITITNLGSGYGFQLFDVTNNVIDVPFSANNGPSFDITDNGAYRVEVVQLDGSNNPIPNSCVFVTEDIGILERDFQVDILTTEANCNSLGDITIQALNVSPNYEYELRLDDGSPSGTLIDNETAQPDNNFTFNNVNPGDYIVITRTDDGCEDIQNISLTRIPDPTLSALTTADIGCSAGVIELTQAGGQGNPDFLFAIWSKDGVLLHTPGGSPTEQEIIDNIDPNAYQVGATFTFGWRDTDGDFIDEYFANEDGEYVFIVLDANNCYALSNPVTINDNGGLAIDLVSEVQPSCNGDADGQLIISVSGGVEPYQYSIDGGTTYQPTDTFVGLTSTTYDIRILDDSGCDIQQSYDLDQPFTLSASAGVSRDVTCDPSNGAEVRITNVVGGYPPYEYSFDGGSNWGSSSIAQLLPGDYTVLVRDASCSFSMDVSVEGLPMPPNVTLTPEVDYNCDGSGTITASPSIAGYDYRYALDGVLNTPESNNVFTNVAPGTYTVTTYYQSQTPPTPSLLLSENFGVGVGSIPSPDTQGYAYEDQTSSTANGGDTNLNINDFQYSVTNEIIAPFSAWISPNDHTDPSSSDGRYLVINVGTPSPGQIIYTKPINDIIPNRPLRISLYIFNLVVSTRTILDPDLTIEIVDASGAVVQSIRTGDIAKNTGPDDWVLFSTDFNPGANTSLDFVIRTEKIGNSGNDLAIDDIEIFQIPEVCELSVTTPVTVEAGRVFSSAVQGSTDISCNGLSDGSITFSVENFDSVAGFEYSEDGGTTWITSTTSPITTNAVFPAGSQTILIRKANEITCTTSITQILTEPTAVVASASITTGLSCTADATITAEANGGLPGYTYQLEDGAGVVIGAYDFATNSTNRVFSGLSDGTYVVRVRDTNNCEDSIDTPIIISPLNPVAFTVTPTTCYSGGNTASIQVDVTDGNGGYQFRINSGPWMIPSPVTSTTYTFNNLSSGSYDIDVRDQLGCPVAIATQTTTINSQLLASATLSANLTCLSDASITINASGGSGTFAYEWSNDSGTTYNTTGFTGNVFATSTAGSYEFRITDTSTPVACTVSTNTVVVSPADTPVISNIIPTDVLCFGDSNGALDITIDTSVGLGPYVIEVVDSGTTTNYGTQTTGLPAGNYDVTVTDANGCVSNVFATSINSPNQINYSINLQPITCDTSTGTNPGSISVEGLSGGVAEYTYYLTGNNGYSAAYNTTSGGEDHTFAILDFGIYEVDVIDANGCSRVTTNIIASPPDDLDIDVSATTLNCLTGGTAAVTVTTAILSTNYEFGILDSFSAPYASTFFPPDVVGGPTHTFTGLTPGITFTFVVHDITTNCYYFEEASAPINSPSVMTSTLGVVNNVTCTGNADGNVSFTIDGFDATTTQVDYEIFLAQSNTSILPTAISGSLSVNPPAGPVSETNIGPLSPGIYFIQFTEADGVNAGCSVSSIDFTIDEASQPLSVSANSTVNDNCNVNAGLITAIAQSGTAPYEYQFLSNLATAPTATDAGWMTNSTANVESGNYIVYVKDAYGCVQNDAVTVDLDDAPDIDLSIVDECADEGSFEVLITLNNPGAAIAPFQISVNGAAYQNFVFNGSNQFTVTGLSSGTGQTISVRDVNGCQDDENFNIVPPIEFTALLTTLLDCEIAPNNNAEITIDVSSGSGNYSYEIDGPGGADQSITAMSGSTEVWNGASVDGVYTITIYDTNTLAPFCQATTTVTVPVAITPAINVDHHLDVSCNGADDGTISVSAIPDNGIGPYIFEIISGPGVSGAVTFPITPNPTSVTNATAVFDNLEGTIAGITYTIRVTAANGCTEEITQVINQPNIISNVNATVVEFGCTTGNNANTASITIDTASITGGSGNFVRFEFINTATAATVQDGANPVYIETNYDGGNYDIYAYDDNGCRNAVEANVGIAPFVEITDPTVADLVPLTCNPGSDAQIQVGVTISPVTATPTIEFEINGINVVYTSTNNTGLFSGLGAGDYSIRITNLDASPNCIIETVHTIEEPLEMDVLATTLTDEECLNNGLDDGSFNFVVSDYAGTFDYQVYNSNNNTVVLQSGSGDTAIAQAPITGLPGGTYYVIVTQTTAPFCVETSNVITIIAPEAPISALVAEEASVSCTNDQGRILVEVSGGEGPFTIALNNTTTSQSYSQNNVTDFAFTGLSAGDFIVTITDALGCVHTDTITLIRPDAIAATIAASTLVCFGDDAASVTATLAARNITPIYEYQLNTYTDILGSVAPQVSTRQGASTFDNLVAGFYSITVTDDVGCSAETGIIEIVNPTEVSSQLIRLSPLTCLNQAVLELSAFGGTAPYRYSVDGINFFPMNETNAPNTHLFSNISAGTYSYFVQDAFNCSSVVSNEITEDIIEPLTLTVDASAAVINCTGENTAVIFADADGGLGNYQYELYTDVSLSVASRIAGPQNQGEFRDLFAGTYYVSVTSNDCVVAPEEVIIAEPTPLTFTEDIVNVSCSGEENGSITVALSGGSGGYQYAISPNLDQFDETNTFVDLAPGDYTIIAQDQNGCFELLNYTITEPNPILVATTTVLPEICQGDEDGSFEIDITGGTAPYRTSLNSSNDADFVQDQISFSNLAAGSYVVFIKDAQDCEENIIVEIEQGVNLNAVVTPVYECNGDVPENRIVVAFEDDTVMSDVLYSMDSTDPSTMQLSPDFTNMSPGMHTLSIAHANGCVNMVDFEIIGFAPLSLTLEQNSINEITAIASGGLEDYTFYFGDIDNGADNTFIINRTDTYMVTLVDQNGCEVAAEIFIEFIDIEIPDFFTPDGDDWNDTWGPENLEAFPNVLTIIFDRYGRELYRMEINDPAWNGLYHNKNLPTGDYWYVIKLRGANDDREFVGHFTLYR
ncbi:T9SS type B sorting domain-containing protein [Croceitalea vernalis]|uniref:T9SS type B sorting domain-containing protein n=1 Tax=Croceitalea vernalis TaxID=3075599 RepID=A0ABU3BE72_9FLAO|nr:T9SS type B sorting domain-containing protein [Croceitalea sp. P007]MDT0620463.1 T9SS type B sorting domain-containing protein [Croceitalea sp. P007]